MKRLLSLILAMLIMLSFAGCMDERKCYDDAPDESQKLPPIVCAKPVVYLYPEEKTEVEVTLDFDGELTSTYPKYNDGWQVTAQSDGTLTDESGREYYCLFWEGEADIEYDMTQGFVVEGSAVGTFLEDALAKLGLTEREADEFIIYWLPQLENNPYNLISFQQEAYTDAAVLDISPKPDCVLRVFMAYKALEIPIDIEPQTLDGISRHGFTVVEWGGTQVQ